MRKKDVFFIMPLPMLLLGSVSAIIYTKDV